jgi:hypothetical protein
MGQLLKLLIELGIDIFNALAKFFTIHFTKEMTVTGFIIAGICLFLFIMSRRG